MLKKTCSHAPRLTSIKAASSRKDRLNKPRRSLEVIFLRCLERRDMQATAGNQPDVPQGTSASAVGYEDVTQTPDRLDEDGFGGIGFDQFAQTRDLDVQAAVERFVFAATGEFHEFVARKGNLGMAGEYLEDGEFAGGDGHLLVVAGERAGGQV